MPWGCSRSLRTRTLKVIKERVGPHISAKGGEQLSTAPAAMREAAAGDRPSPPCDPREGNGLEEAAKPRCQSGS